MKKSGEENIILFPNVERRLAEKGIEALQVKNYREAADFLEQAYELDPANSDVMAALVLAYFEAGALRKAKELCREMLLTGAGDYFQLTEMYLTILIQLHEYSEITEVLEALFEEREVPPEKTEHFQTILEFCKRMAENEPLHKSMEQLDEDNPAYKEAVEIRPGELDFFKLNDLREQVVIAGKLASQPIDPLLPEIRRFLGADTGHPFLKTMLLNVCKEQQINTPLTVMKFGIKQDFIPNELPELHLIPIEVKIARLLEEELEQSEPVLLESVLSLVHRHYIAVYPFELKPVSPAAWAAAFHYTAIAYLGSSPDMESVGQIYKGEEGDMAKAVKWIEKVEEISYPII
ncbi:tetratricopeptide repeat protein [Neobacillus notoginsengisoli]|nr:tetratricopeptide repeat protein [Neobacillus notoginsengisoli]